MTAICVDEALIHWMVSKLVVEAEARGQRDDANEEQDARGNEEDSV